MKKLNIEQGQIIIIIALAIVVVLGFTAVAVDGTMIYSEKRADQSSADSAALAGAGAAAQYLKTANMSGFSCGGSVASSAASSAINVAIDTAAKDGFVLAINDISTNGVTTTCGIYNGRKYIDVHVVTTSTTNPKFIGFVQDDPITTSAEAVARVYINTSFASGNLIYTTGTACSYSSSPYGGIHATGNGNITVKHGGIFSNSCLQTTGSSDIFVYDGVAQYMGTGSTSFYSGSVKQTTVGNGILPNTNTTAFILNDPDTSSGASISTYTSQSYQLWSSYTANPNIPEEFWPSPTTQSITAEMEAVSLPTCPTNTGSFPSPSSTSVTYVNPGKYSSSVTWSGWGGHTLEFKPGVYCFSGSLTLTGGNDHMLFDPGVILYFTGSGGFTLSGGINKVTMSGTSVFITNGNFSLTSAVNLTADEIMFYLGNGSFTIDGASTGALTSFASSNSVNAIPGVLVYFGNSNSSGVSINGSGGLQAYGTIYAPNSLVKVTGASTSNTMDVQIIGKAVWVAGSGTVNMDSDGATLYSQGSTTIQLLK